MHIDCLPPVGARVLNDRHAANKQTPPHENLADIVGVPRKVPRPAIAKLALVCRLTYTHWGERGGVSNYFATVFVTVELKTIRVAFISALYLEPLLPSTCSLCYPLASRPLLSCSHSIYSNWLAWCTANFDHLPLIFFSVFFVFVRDSGGCFSFKLNAFLLSCSFSSSLFSATLYFL